MKMLAKTAALAILLCSTLPSYSFDLLPYAKEMRSKPTTSGLWYVEGVNKIYANQSPSSAREGFQLVEKASSLGVPHALGTMGLFHEQGLFVKKDTNLAKRYYEEAVSQGSPIGFYGMARVYENGYGGVEPNISDRNFWLRKGADSKNKESVFAMAIAYERGQGLAVNHRTAARYYLTACDSQMLEACYNLGIKLAQGMDLPQSYYSALALLLYAQDNGFSPATKAIEGFIRYVPERDLEKAIKAASIMTKSKTVDALGLSF